MIPTYTCIGILTHVTCSIDTPSVNLQVNTAGNLDWANVSETRKADEPTGQNDNSFGQGSKKATPVPSVVSGSIPNKKSDLTTFVVYLETNANGQSNKYSEILHLGYAKFLAKPQNGVVSATRGKIANRYAHAKGGRRSAETQPERCARPPPDRPPVRR